MKSALVAGFLLSLAACGDKDIKSPSSEPVVVVKEKAVGVDAPCVPDTLKPAPEYVDTAQALRSLGDKVDERLQLLYAGRAQREARLNELEPVVAACPRGSVKKK